MTINNKTSINSQHNIGLESFFPMLYEKKSTTITATPAKTITTILILRRFPTSDIWICNSCTLTGDKWFMENHPCKQNIRNNFAKVAQRFQERFLRGK